MGVVLFSQVIQAGDSGQPVARVRELELLAQLFLMNIDEDVTHFEGGRINVDVILGVELPERRDRLQGQHVGYIVRRRPGDTPMSQFRRIG